MPFLKYVGPNTFDGSAVPLPQGWPAAEHFEPDEELAKEKLAFRVKRGRINKDGQSELAPGEAAYELEKKSEASAEVKAEAEKED